MSTALSSQRPLSSRSGPATLVRSFSRKWVCFQTALRRYTSRTSPLGKKTIEPGLPEEVGLFVLEIKWNGRALHRQLS